MSEYKTVHMFHNNPSDGFGRSDRHPSSDRYQLKLEQQPVTGKAHGEKYGDRKPLDPPPIVRVFVDDGDPNESYLASPNFFMKATVSRPDNETIDPSILSGTTVASANRLKHPDNRDGAFFCFADLSVKTPGNFQLRFSLYEMRQGHRNSRGEEAPYMCFLASVSTMVFEVLSSKKYKGQMPSTALTRSFSEQGVKFKIKKETRPGRYGRKYHHDPYMHPHMSYPHHASLYQSSGSYYNAPPTDPRYSSQYSQDLQRPGFENPHYSTEEEMRRKRQCMPSTQDQFYQYREQNDASRSWEATHRSTQFAGYQEEVDSSPSKTIASQTPSDTNDSSPRPPFQTESAGYRYSDQTHSVHDTGRRPTHDMTSYGNLPYRSSLHPHETPDDDRSRPPKFYKQHENDDPPGSGRYSSFRSSSPSAYRHNRALPAIQSNEPTIPRTLQTQESSISGREYIRLPPLAEAVTQSESWPLGSLLNSRAR